MKTVNYTLFFLILTISTYGQDYNVYKLETVRFADKDFTFDFHSFGISGPTALAFKENGDLIINDPLGDRIKLYDPSMRLLRVAEKENIGYSDGYIYSNSMLLATDRAGAMVSLIWLDKNNFYTISYRDLTVSVDDFKTVYLGQVLFLNTNTPSLLSILNPGPDQDVKNQRILDSAQTRTLFQEPTKYGIEGVTIDSKNRLFLHGELQTRDYKTFYDYFGIYNKNIPSGLRNPSKFLQESPIYLGKDQSLNVYWQVSSAVLIFDFSGKMLDFFIPEEWQRLKTSYAIHPSGDIYFLDYDQKGVYVYRIKNVWDPEGRATWRAKQAN